MDFTKQDFTKTNPEDRPVHRELPPGAYIARISGEETKPTKKGDGEYLQITLAIDEGDYTGVQLVDRLNLRNPSASAMAKARETLQRICEATGAKPKNSSELLGLRVKVLTYNESYQGKSYARIRDYNSAPDREPAPADIDDLPF